VGSERRGGVRASYFTFEISDLKLGKAAANGRNWPSAVVRLLRDKMAIRLRPTAARQDGTWPMSLRLAKAGVSSCAQGFRRRQGYSGQDGGQVIDMNGQKFTPSHIRNLKGIEGFTEFTRFAIVSLRRRAGAWAKGPPGLNESYESYESSRNYNQDFLPHPPSRKAPARQGATEDREGIPGGVGDVRLRHASPTLQRRKAQIAAKSCDRFFPEQSNLEKPARLLKVFELNQ
jgi:hypothetical protein